MNDPIYDPDADPLADLETPETAPADPRKPRGPLVWPIALCVLLVLAVGVWFFWFRGTPEAPVTAAAPAPASEPQTPEAAPEETSDWQLPPLEASDSALRLLVGELSSHPRLIAWLANDELVRRFTVAVTNIAEGESPRSHIAFVAPDAEFQAAVRGDRVVVDPASYERYRTLTEVIESIDARGAAEGYDRVEPLLDEALQELGYPDADFRTKLLAALRELLATPRLETPPVLVRRVSSYEYADPRLEALSPAQKHLLRLGPEYATRVQGKLYELGIALGFTPEELG